MAPPPSPATAAIATAQALTALTSPSPIREPHLPPAPADGRPNPFPTPLTLRTRHLDRWRQELPKAHRFLSRQPVVHPNDAVLLDNAGTPRPPKKADKKKAPSASAVKPRAVDGPAALPQAAVKTAPANISLYAANAAWPSGSPPRSSVKFPHLLPPSPPAISLDETCCRWPAAAETAEPALLPKKREPFPDRTPIPAPVPISQPDVPQLEFFLCRRQSLHNFHLEDLHAKKCVQNPFPTALARTGPALPPARPPSIMPPLPHPQTRPRPAPAYAAAAHSIPAADASRPDWYRRLSASPSSSRSPGEYAAPCAPCAKNLLAYRNKWPGSGRSVFHRHRPESAKNPKWPASTLVPPPAASVRFP